MKEPLPIAPPLPLGKLDNNLSPRVGDFAQKNHPTPKLPGGGGTLGDTLDTSIRTTIRNLKWKLLSLPAKIDFNFHWKSPSLQTETSDFGPDFLFSFLNSAQPTGWIF